MGSNTTNITVPFSPLLSLSFSLPLSHPLSLCFSLFLRLSTSSHTNCSSIPRTTMNGNHVFLSPFPLPPSLSLSFASTGSMPRTCGFHASQPFRCEIRTWDSRNRSSVRDLSALTATVTLYDSVRWYFARLLLLLQCMKYSLESDICHKANNKSSHIVQIKWARRLKL